MDSEQLDTVVETAAYAAVIQLLVVDIFWVIVIPLVAVYKLKAQRTACNVWCQMVMLWFCFAAYIARDIHFMNGMWEEQDYLYTYVDLVNGDNLLWRIINAVGPFFYVFQHWLFAASYFRIAIIFKLVFSVQSEKVTKELQRREVRLFVFSLTVFLFTALPILLSAFNSNQNYTQTLLILVIVAYSTIIVVLSISLYRIRKFSKMLVANTVFLNERLMIVHYVSFSLLCIA